MTKQLEGHSMRCIFPQKAKEMCYTDLVIWIIIWTPDLSLFLSVLMAIFTGEPGSAGFIGAKDDGLEVVVTTRAIRHAKLQSNHHHQQTNTRHYTGRIPFLSPNQQCQSNDRSSIYILSQKLSAYIPFNGHFPGESGLAGCPHNSPSPFLNCTSVWDRPKLSMSFLTQSHQVFRASSP